MNALFLKSIRKFANISEEEAAFFFSFFQERKYKRNTVLLREGDVAHEAYFVLKGALRQFFSNGNGVEKTCNFTFEAEFFTDLESFSRKSRAATNIITLEPTECLVIKCTELGEATNQSTAAAEICKSIIENIATDNIKRIQSLLSLSPEEQFTELVQCNPQILQRVPQRYIAQYLGVAPESLSRIRKRILIAEKA
jgi:CRP/FNR family transcriptional regulator